MRSVSYRLADLIKARIPLGFVGENEHTVVQFDAKQAFDQYPTATPSLTVKNPSGEKYPAVVVRDGDMVIWTISDSDLIVPGHGEFQLQFKEGDTVMRSYVGETRIERSIMPTGDVPTPVQNWIDAAEDVLEEVEEAIPAGGTTGQVLAKKSDADRDTEWVDQTGGGGGTTNYNSLSNKPQIGGVTLSGNKTLHDLGAAAEADIPDVSGFYTKPAAGIPASDIADGVIPVVHNVPAGGSTNQVLAKNSGTDYDLKWVNQSGGSVTVDNELSTTSTNPVQNKVITGAVQELSEAIVPLSETKSSDASSVDLDLTDPSGNVLLRLANGHIQTKNFDSSEGSKIKSRMGFGAHNGAEYYAPECTVPAYRIAGQQGWEWAWIAGVDFSTDGTMYVIHDDTVDRTTDGTGYLNQMTDQQINALNIDQTGEGYNLSDFDPSELKIPTLEQVVQQCVRYGMKMVLRISLFPNGKNTTENTEKWDNLEELIKGHGIKNEDISFYLDNGTKVLTVRTIFGDDAEVCTHLGLNATAQDFVDWFGSREITGPKAAIISYTQLDLNAVKLLHKNGIRVYAYSGSNSQTYADNCASWGVDVYQNSKIHKISY